VNRPNRVRVAEQLSKAGVRVAMLGGQATDGRRIPEGVVGLPYCPPLLLPSVLESAKCAISIDYRDDLNYCSDRLYLLAGAGCCVIHRGGGPRLTGVLSAVTDDDIVDHAKAVARGEIDRSGMGMMARHHVREYHSYVHRLHAIGKILKRRIVR